jgi:hypothetical protein
MVGMICRVKETWLSSRSDASMQGTPLLLLTCPLRLECGGVEMCRCGGVGFAGGAGAGESLQGHDLSTRTMRGVKPGDGISLHRADKYEGRNAGNAETSENSLRAYATGWRGH